MTDFENIIELQFEAFLKKFMVHCQIHSQRFKSINAPGHFANHLRSTQADTQPMPKKNVQKLQLTQCFDELSYLLHSAI